MARKPRLNALIWAVMEDTDHITIIRNRITGEVKVINKQGGQNNE